MVYLVLSILHREVKSIAEQAEEESAEIWVDKLRRTQKEKEIAEQRVCMYTVLCSKQYCLHILGFVIRKYVCQTLSLL